MNGHSACLRDRWSPAAARDTTSSVSTLTTLVKVSPQPLQDVRKELLGSDFNRDRASVRGVFRKMFRELVCLWCPERPCLVHLGENPILTEALSTFAVRGGSVGQSVAAVGRVRGCEVHNDLDFYAADCY